MTFPQSYKLEVTRLRWLTLGTRYRKLKLAGVALAASLAVAVPVAWASHDFSDVPDAHQFHGPISAIEGAGITTGCGGGNYCPDDFVRRDAMAAFMQRGFGRVAQTEFGVVTVPVSETAATATSSITTGAVAGTGFLQSDASVQIFSDCDTLYRVKLVLQGYGYMGSWGAWQNIPASTYGELSLTGVAPAGAGAKTVEVRIFGGCGAASSVGNVTTAYFPFGSMGTSSLAIDGATTGHKGRFGPADK